MKIGEVARQTGWSAKAIRHYEAEGLISSRRLDNGYRDYTSASLRQLRLLARARHVGFSLAECGGLLQLLADPARHSADVKTSVLDKIVELDQQMDSLRQMRELLQELADRCAGNEDSECAILTELAAPSQTLRFTLIEESDHE